MRQKTCCASESNTSVRVVFANRSGFVAPIVVDVAWEERRSCLNIFRTTNRSRISGTFMNYEAKDLLRRRQITVGSQKPSRNMRQNTCCTSESNTSVRVLFTNRSGFDAPIGVVKSTWHGRSVDHVLTYSDGKSRSDVRNLHELRGKRLVAQVSQTRRLALYLQTVVALMLQLESSWQGRSVDHVLPYSGRQIASIWHGRSVDHVLTYFGRQIVSTWQGRSVDHVLTYSGRQIAVESQKPSRIMRQKTCCASESKTSVRVVFANRSGFYAPIGIVLVREERGSCLNIFQTKNRGQISETFTNYEAKDLLHDKSRSNLRNLLELRGKTLVAQVSQTRRFALYFGTGVVLMLQLVSSWHRRSEHNVLTYSGRQIAVKSQKPSRITRQKTCCTSESKTSVCVVFATRSGLDAPIGVVLALGGMWILSYHISDNKLRSDL
ncbi:uncharacterized protein G2W53_014410 [Senna tora]|uniref:Uncharacterized protein n=1 Tax=Senna tora TaxID=362788 RepID=A0A834WTH4_9FABA|nr:uncharacterized protein G2W53_014410 [Senna tora]